VAIRFPRRLPGIRNSKASLGRMRVRPTVVPYFCMRKVGKPAGGPRSPPHFCEPNSIALLRERHLGFPRRRQVAPCPAAGRQGGQGLRWGPTIRKIIKMTSLETIVAFLDRELNIKAFADESHNGLQVENFREKSPAWRSASTPPSRSSEEAVRRKAQMVICHHGLSWGDSLKRNHRAQLPAAEVSAGP